MKRKAVLLVLTLCLCAQGCSMDDYSVISKECSAKKSIQPSAPNAGVSKQLSEYLNNNFNKVSIEKKEVPYTGR